MDIRSQISMVFHLDKCIGCHTCSIACKNIWTDRKGAEYMWWNNVETKPGTGYPGKWEDQDIYKGGWKKNGDGIELKGAGKRIGLKNIFHNPSLPVIDDYYDPFTYKYLDLIESPAAKDQPTARPVSLITGEPMWADAVHATTRWHEVAYEEAVERSTSAIHPYQAVREVVAALDEDTIVCGDGGEDLPVG